MVLMTNKRLYKRVLPYRVCFDMGSIRVFALYVVLFVILLDTFRLNGINYTLKQTNDVQAKLYASYLRTLSDTVLRFDSMKDDADTPELRLIVTTMKIALDLKFDK